MAARTQGRTFQLLRLANLLHQIIKGEAHLKPMTLWAQTVPIRTSFPDLRWDDITHIACLDRWSRQGFHINPTQNSEGMRDPMGLHLPEAQPHQLRGVVRPIIRKAVLQVRLPNRPAPHQQGHPGPVPPMPPQGQGSPHQELNLQVPHMPHNRHRNLQRILLGKTSHLALPTILKRKLHTDTLQPRMLQAKKVHTPHLSTTGNSDRRPEDRAPGDRPPQDRRPRGRLPGPPQPLTPQQRTSPGPRTQLFHFLLDHRTIYRQKPLPLSLRRGSSPYRAR